MSESSMGGMSSQDLNQFAEQNADKIREMEMSLMARSFVGMRRLCTEKCSPASLLKHSELTKAESVCLDRCASKYLATFQRVGEHLQKMSEQQ
ncbi:MAG: Mitochondrial import inner membrane translocase subunit Tim10 [Marteilia pararefringens]